MKLRGWHYVGIFVSLFWIISAGYYEQTELAAKQANMNAEGYKACHQLGDEVSDVYKHCVTALQADEANNAGHTKYSIYLFAFTPIPLGWGVAFFVANLVRMIKGGSVKRYRT